MNPLRRLAGQTAIYGLSSIIGRLLNYLLVPIYTRVFFPSEFGVIAELYAYISFLNVLLTYGMETAFFRYYEMSDKKEQVFYTSFLSLLSTSVFFALIIFVFSNKIAELIRYTDHVEYIIWLGLIVTLDAISTIPFAKLRADNRPKLFALIKLLNIGFNIGFNLFFIVLCPYIIKHYSHYHQLNQIISAVYNPAIGVGYVFIANLIACAFTFIMLIPIIFKNSFSFDKQLWKTMIQYAWPLLIAGMAGIVNETIDRILLKFLLPVEVSMGQLGIYSACYKISIIITIFIQAFRFAADPFFFSQAKNKDSKDVYASVMHYFALTCLTIFLVIMLYIDIVKYFIGSNYYEGLGVVPILLMANVFLGIYYNLSIWYKLSGKTIYGAYLSILGASITLILNFWWIPLWGYTGAAWATLICYFSMMTASYIIGQKHYNVNYNLRRAIAYFILSLLLYGLSILIKAHLNDYKFILNSILLIIYFLVIYLVEKNKVKIKQSLHPST